MFDDFDLMIQSDEFATEWEDYMAYCREIEDEYEPEEEYI